jgi:hypothetical protein
MPAAVATEEAMSHPMPGPRGSTPDPIRARSRVARGSSQGTERLPGRPPCRAGDAQQAERRFLNERWKRP